VARILVVDDDPDILALVRFKLEASGRCRCGPCAPAMKA